MGNPATDIVMHSTCKYYMITMQASVSIGVRFPRLAQTEWKEIVL